MHDQQGTTPLRCRRGACILPAVLLTLFASGCADRTTGVRADDRQLAAYVELIMPKDIKIQRDWTKPVSFARDGNADGLEVILAAHDSFEDRTKIAGTLHFELYTRRMASADRRGKRVAFWPVELNSREMLKSYWDSLSRFYCFPLQLTQTPLPPGRYILSAELWAPAGERLFDEYEFTHEAGTAPPARVPP